MLYFWQDIVRVLSSVARRVGSYTEPDNTELGRKGCIDTMLTAYLNYPNSHVTIHADADCATIQQQHKQNQRVIRLNGKTLSTEFERFEIKYYQFGADQGTNDMWLYVEFLDPAFERAVVEYIRRLLGAYYSPFNRVTVNEHC